MLIYQIKNTGSEADYLIRLQSIWEISNSSARKSAKNETVGIVSALVASVEIIQAGFLG